MTTDARLIEAWDRGDPALTPAEKETTIRWAKDTNEAIIHTDEAGVGRRLIAHPESTVSAVNVLTDLTDTRDRPTPEEVTDDHEVVGVTVRLPIGAVSVGSESRKSPQHAEVVSKRVLDMVADGGYQVPSRGAVVQDRDDDTDEELIVVDTHPEVRADDHVLEAVGGLTVAELNPGYDPSAPVVEAVYNTEIEQKLGTWRSVEDLRDAVEFDALSTYSFPADRLATVYGGVEA